MKKLILKLIALVIIFNSFIFLIFQTKLKASSNFVKHANNPIISF